MSRLDKNLIKASLWYLINQNRETFVENMTTYLQDRAEVLEFLFNGPLPITSEIESKLAEAIKRNLPSDSDFKGIVKVEIGFNYSSEQQYLVTYKANRYYDKDKRPYGGQAVQDQEHPISVVTEQQEYISSKCINN